MKLIYQAAQEEDIPSIFELNKQLIDQYEDIKIIDYEQVLKWVYQKIETHIQDYQVIFLGTNKVGYFYLHDKDGKMELDDLYILETYRGQGIGSQVLRDCLTQSKQRKRNLFLYVFSQNRRAISLYQSFGFEVIKAIGKTRYIMEVELII